jgi:hypothetical protein
VAGDIQARAQRDKHRPRDGRVKSPARIPA